MNTRPDRIAWAIDFLGQARLNDAEQLRLAEKLIDGVFTLVGPMTDPQMCIAEGYMASASHAVEQARLLVESWPHDSLPFDPDLEPENTRETPPRVDQSADDLLIRARLMRGVVVIQDSVGSPRSTLRIDIANAATHVEITAERIRNR